MSEGTQEQEPPKEIPIDVSDFAHAFGIGLTGLIGKNLQTISNNINPLPQSEDLRKISADMQRIHILISNLKRSKKVEVFFNEKMQSWDFIFSPEKEEVDPQIPEGTKIIEKHVAKRFLGAFNHSMNNPLATVVGFTQLLEYSGTKENIDAIQEAGKTAMAIDTSLKPLRIIAKKVIASTNSNKKTSITATT